MESLNYSRINWWPSISSRPLHDLVPSYAASPDGDVEKQLAERVAIMEKQDIHMLSVQNCFQDMEVQLFSSGDDPDGEATLHSSKRNQHLIRHSNLQVYY